MYRYTSATHSAYGSAKTKRLLQFALLIITVVAIVLAVLLANAVSFKQNYELSSVRQLQYDISQAVGQINNLSRTGGTSTTGVLAKMRQHVYAAEMFEDQYEELIGKRHIEDDTFQLLIKNIEEFEAKKIAGQQTIEQQTALTAILTDLETYVDSLSE